MFLRDRPSYTLKTEHPSECIERGWPYPTLPSDPFRALKTKDGYSVSLFSHAPHWVIRYLSIT